jgi:hypothetical protein
MKIRGKSVWKPRLTQEMAPDDFPNIPLGIESFPRPATIRRTPTGSITTLPSGEQIPATPHDTDGYRATAREHGYGADTTLLCQEHDLTHVALAAWLGLPVSPTLQAVADGREWEHAWIEEAAVLAVQRYARVMGLDLWNLWERRVT